MTAPMPRRRGDGGFSQLGTWIRTSVKNDVIAAAADENRKQRDVVEEALADYFTKRAKEKEKARVFEAVASRPLPQPPAPKRA